MPTSGAFNALFDTGSGSFKVTFPTEVDVDLTLDSGSGAVVFEVPSSAAVQVDVRDSGSGSIRIPNSFTQVQSGEGDEGVWETAGFASADVQIVIVVEDMGSGSLTIR